MPVSLTIVGIMSATDAGAWLTLSPLVFDDFGLTKTAVFVPVSVLSSKGSVSVYG